MDKHFRNIKLFAFDLDGTLYLGDNAIPGAVELIRELRKSYQVVYFTNNSTKTIRQLTEKLTGLGFACGPTEVYSSAAATADYLKESGLNDLYLIGSSGLQSEVEARGLIIRSAELARNLVVGLDSEFNYQKISAALAIIQKGGKFIACNEDRNFPVGEGKLLPACGAMVGAIAAAADKRPDFVVGKPNSYLLSRLAAEHSVEAGEIMVVGDSYDSDILMALNYNSKAVLIGRQDVADKNVRAVDNLGQLRRLIRSK